MIEIGRPMHLTESKVIKEVLNQKQTGEPISDSAAATIASWFQTPTGHGLTFATLSSTGRADVKALSDAIAFELHDPGYDTDTKGALIALHVFAQSFA